MNSIFFLIFAKKSTVLPEKRENVAIIRAIMMIQAVYIRKEVIILSEKNQGKDSQPSYQAEKIISWVFAGQQPKAKHWQWYEQLSQSERQRYQHEQEVVCAQRQIQIMTPDDAVYPQQWRNNELLPKVIYVQGQSQLLQAERSLSIVGSRQPSEYSQVVAQHICHFGVAHGFTLISGMAQGIDSTAHWVALEQQGATIAVLGFGHDYCYPKTNTHFHLKRQLSQSQLVISQYPPMTPPAKWRFIERNFLIATLSQATVVIQAKEKSGSLLTAEMALEAGRDVYIVTGVFGDESYVGGHRLIEDGAIALQYFWQILSNS